MLRLVLCVLTLPLSLPAAHAEAEPEFLTIQDGFYSEVVGDGYETGVVVPVSFYSANDQAVPLIEIPEPDNHAECAVMDVELVKKTKDSINDNIDFYTYDYKVYVSTSVLGDSGGCLIFVKNDEGSIQRIINYSYMTDF